MPDETEHALDEALQKSIDARLAALGPAVPTPEQAAEWVASDDPFTIDASVDIAEVLQIVLGADMLLLVELRREIEALRSRVSTVEDQLRQ